MEKIIVLDVETTNSIDDPLCYDIGFIVADLQGKVYGRFSYVVADVFCNKQLMESAYFADKIPQYWADIKNGARQLKTLYSIRKIFREVCEMYNVKKVFAFNVRFDYNALNTTQRFITCSKFRYYLPYGTEIMDILKLARNVLKNNEDYRKFCVENNYLTARGVNRYTAEIVYRYWYDKDFNEEHTGLADVEIEYKILLKCLESIDVYEGKLW